MKFMIFKVLNKIFTTNLFIFIFIRLAVYRRERYVMGTCKFFFYSNLNFEFYAYRTLLQLWTQLWIPFLWFSIKWRGFLAFCFEFYTWIGWELYSVVLNKIILNVVAFFIYLYRFFLIIFEYTSEYFKWKWNFIIQIKTLTWCCKDLYIWKRKSLD